MVQGWKQAHSLGQDEIFIKKTIGDYNIFWKVIETLNNASVRQKRIRMPLEITVAKEESANYHDSNPRGYTESPDDLVALHVALDLR
jgi:hypothetical protein